MKIKKEVMYTSQGIFLQFLVPLPFQTLKGDLEEKLQILWVTISDVTIRNTLTA